MALNIVIMAAGKGTRMKSARPKVLHRLAGTSLLQHVLNTCVPLQANRTIVITGHGAEAVEAEARGEALHFVRQVPQLGTGHAIQQVLGVLDDSAATTLILNGDVPLIRADTAGRLAAACGGKKLALLTIELADATGYGRIRRDAAGGVLGIVEHKDATPAQRAVREIYTGMMAAPTAALKRWVMALKNDNVQGEYYLTDIVAMAVADGVPVVAAQPASETEVLGVNSPVQLAELERRFQRAHAESLMEAGVRLADPARLDVRGTLHCGSEVEIDVNCVFEGEVRLGDGVRIGANCVIRDADIDAGAVIHPFTHIEGAQIGAGRAGRPLRAAAPRRRAGRGGAHRQLRRGEEQHAGRRRQGQPSGLPGRRHRRAARQLRRRQHHRQLRRRQQAPHGHRRRCAHRLQLRAGRADHHRRGRDRGGRLDAVEGCAGRPVDGGTRPAGQPAELEATHQDTSLKARPSSRCG